MEKHTPTPWKVGHVATGGNMDTKYNQSFAIVQFNPNPTLIGGVFRDVRGGDETAKANAELIVKAVNAHAELVALLSKALPLARNVVTISAEENDAKQRFISQAIDILKHLESNPLKKHGK